MQQLISVPTSDRQAMLLSDWLRIAEDPRKYFERHYEAMGFSTLEQALSWAESQGVKLGGMPDFDND